MPLDERPSLPVLVRKLVADATFLRDTLPCYEWSVKAVTKPSYGMMRWMQQRLLQVAAQQMPTYMYEFSGWMNAVPAMGKRLVFHTVPKREGERDPLNLNVAKVDVHGHTPEQIKEWFLYQNTCDKYVSFVSAALQLAIAGGCAPMHALKDGTPLELVRIDTMVGCVQLAFTGMTWSDNGNQVDSLRSFSSPEALTKAGRHNHRFLRFALRNTKTGKLMYMWCDPTARQVLSDLPLTDKEGSPLHVKMWPDEMLPEQYTKYGAPEVQEHDEQLDELDNVEGPCHVAAFLYSLHMTKVNMQDNATKTNTEQDKSLALTQHKAMAFLDKISPLPIDWDDALGRLEERKMYDAMEMYNVMGGTVCMTRDPHTGEWKPFAPTVAEE